MIYILTTDIFARRFIEYFNFSYLVIRCYSYKKCACSTQVKCHYQKELLRQGNEIFLNICIVSDVSGYEREICTQCRGLDVTARGVCSLKIYGCCVKRNDRLHMCSLKIDLISLLFFTPCFQLATKKQSKSRLDSSREQHLVIHASYTLISCVKLQYAIVINCCN